MRLRPHPEVAVRRALPGRVERADERAQPNSSAVIVGPGAIGSCRWMTSKSSSRSARIVRSCADGSGASGATEPFAAVGTLRPRGVTPASGGGPSHGPEHAHLVARAAQSPGQAQHLALHAARDGQRVRADQADAHRRETLRRSGR